MATPKKPATKTTTAKRKPVAKKTVARKSSKPAPMQSFKVSRDEPPFLSFRVTKQTVYWSILLIFILLMQVWVLNAQLDVVESLDSLTAI